MLTFLSESIRRILGKSPEHPHLRALPQPTKFSNDLRMLLAAWKRAELHLVTESDERDIPVAPVFQVSASAFIAGQGARIYSLDAFRSRGPRRPRAA
jgi:hypothetical protein